MSEFDLNHQRHLKAAKGWLGSWQEAHQELQNIAAASATRAGVLALRFEMYSKAGKWGHTAGIVQSISELLPDYLFEHFHLALACSNSNGVPPGRFEFRRVPAGLYNKDIFAGEAELPW